MNLRVPVNFLVNARLPDRDIYRLLALGGPMRTRAIRERLRIAADACYSACARLERQRLIATRRSQNGRCAEWHVCS